MLKHSDFPSEWRKLRFRGLQISKCSEGGYNRTPSCKNMDPGQDLQRKFLFKPFREFLNVGSEMPGRSENHFAHLELLRDKVFRAD